MEKKYVGMIVVIVLVVLFVLGSFLGAQRIDIAGCTAEWKTVDVTVQSSPLCPSATCTAHPDAQQHNAIVNAMVCACEKAKAVQYTDTAINSRIQDVTKSFFGYDITAQQLCDSPGEFLVERSYG